MKRNGYTLFCVCLISLTGNSQEPEQTAPPAKKLHQEIAIGVGAGSGFTSLAFRTADGSGELFPEIYNHDLVKIFETPVVTLDLQEPVGDKGSLGAAISGQMFRVGYVADSNGTRVVNDYGDSYSRINIAIRGMFNFARRPSANHYAGMRLGCTFWFFDTKSTVPGYREEQKLLPMPGIQFFYGFRHFFGPVGVGFEFGLGTAPYLVQANVAYRLD